MKASEAVKIEAVAEEMMGVETAISEEVEEEVEKTASSPAAMKAENSLLTHCSRWIRRIAHTGNLHWMENASPIHLI